MKSILINTKRFNVPETWMDVRLNQFLKIKEIEENIDTIEFYDYTLSILSVLTGCPFEELEKLTPEDLGKLSTTLVSITSSPVYEVKDIGININGEPFIFDMNPNKMILGQFIDLDLFAQDNKTWENAHKIAAVFWRFPKEKVGKFDKARLKVGKKINYSKYTPEEYNSINTELNSEFFKENLPMPYVNTAVVFFCVLRNQYKQFMLRSLKIKEEKAQKNKAKQSGATFKRNGTGTPQ